MLASGMLLVAVLTCFSVIIITSEWRQRKILRKMPQGPTPLPFLGNFLDTKKFYDSLLKEKNPQTHFPKRNLLMTTLNLFFVGTEMDSTAMSFNFLLLMKHLPLQTKVHEEIDQVIGRNQQPQYEDRMQTPYTKAVIHEIQRYGDIIPLGVACRTTKDIKFWGILIPKGTDVLPILGSLLKDPKYFSNPNDFNPQQFQHNRGQFKKSNPFMLFSVGEGLVPI
ncbi:LOW QUALITY PROTEIN: cytochrome P450 2A8-like [Apodemus sylvaticus]|uniref:LOW QUALITY PROTEIN: cytochrome P450 2A8-like n=1 Tax=Apodemus sylvaticus TaxID=10129 RepID=UPI00224241E4|nr:LOW QUALITY PROTEIN: cytochrome P450 2A8-like [Apodemus sylvaticus]